MAIIKRNQAAIWSNAQNGKFEGYEPLGIGSFGSVKMPLFPALGKIARMYRMKMAIPFWPCLPILLLVARLLLL
jgi:hypothetical protein